MEIEIRHCICMINFSVCQTLNITQGEEVLLLLYFNSVLGFYSIPNIMENVNYKLQNSSRMNHQRSSQYTAWKFYERNAWTSLALCNICGSLLLSFNEHFFQTEDVLEKATMTQSLWVIINSKSEEKPHNYLIISLWAWETLKKLWRQQKKCQYTFSLFSPYFKIENEIWRYSKNTKGNGKWKVLVSEIHFHLKKHFNFFSIRKLDN